jgi:hypothetical protein
MFGQAVENALALYMESRSLWKEAAMEAIDPKNTERYTQEWRTFCEEYQKKHGVVHPVCSKWV